MIDEQSLANSVLIVAHPDDEVLWFSSILKSVSQVIFVFNDYSVKPSLGEARRRTLQSLPFHVTSLSIPEPGSLRLCDWLYPTTTDYGLLPYQHKRLTPAGSAYERNAHLVYDRLRPELDAVTHVFTHNPWGEYGHEDHVQVYRVVERLRLELQFELLVSMYVSSRSNRLAQHYALADNNEPLTCAIDQKWASTVADVYKHHGCWTWANDWAWDREETFLGPLCYRLPQHDNINNSVTNSRFLRQVPTTTALRRSVKFPETNN